MCDAPSTILDEQQPVNSPVAPGLELLAFHENDASKAEVFVRIGSWGRVRGGFSETDTGFSREGVG